MKKKLLSLLLILATASPPALWAQEIHGQHPALAGASVRLYGFRALDRYAIAATQADAEGNFSLPFAPEHYGVGLLSAGEQPELLLLLSAENLELQGDTSAPGLRVTAGAQNLLFQQYRQEQALREQALSAWRFLQSRYGEEAYFAAAKRPRKSIDQELRRLQEEEKRFLAQLPADAYLRWYIPTRKLLGSVATIAQYQNEKIPATRAALQALDYGDERLYTSGLLQNALDNHVWFIENSSGPLDSVFEDLNRSVDSILARVQDDEEKYNLLAQYLFELLEKRSLYGSSQYLSQKLLSPTEEGGCLDPELEKRLHKYGLMAVGQRAPDIVFGPHTYFPAGSEAPKMSALGADYYLVVFAASWCGHCSAALPELSALYPRLKAKGVEVVLVALEEQTENFVRFAAPLPFISTTDYQKWESPSAQDYQVVATPSYFLLDQDLRIVQRLSSVAQAQNWLESPR